jgi:predicted dehydrogenase
VIRGAALVGCGLIGARRARALVSLGVPVLAVCDVERDRAVALAEALPGHVVATDTPDSALATDGVDLAVISTLHNALAPLTVLALDAQCHVLVEKPGAAGLSALTDMAAAAHRNDRLVRVGYNHRFHPAVEKAAAIVASGDYGSVMHIRARYGHGGRPGYESEWRAQRGLSGGGELLDQGVHLIDLVRLISGDVSLAFAELRTSFWETDVEDNAFLALRAADGVFAWLHASWTEWKNLFAFEVVLERAKVELEGLGGSYGTERCTLHAMLPELGPPVTTIWEWPRGDESWTRETGDALGAFAGLTAVGASLDDALAVMRVVDEAYAGRRPLK